MLLNLKKNLKLCSQSIASVFKCGKTQIQKIIQQKDELKAAYEANHSEFQKRKYLLEFDDIDVKLSINSIA